ncbi:MAG: glycosyltransferase family 2 protein [Bacteroidetes bacterium]|nr:glycosyltransferase family 2 protein [Bacteroidota bacterium]
MATPLVSIITVNYDHAEETCQLLASLQKITYPAIEVIVVDNASPHQDPSLIETQFPEATLIRSGKNLGFAGGNNLGIRHAKGSYILLLNNDTEVTPGFLEPLVNKLESDPSIGAVSPQIRFFHHPDTFQYAGSAPVHPITVRSHGIGYLEKDHGQYNRDAMTAFVHGAAMLIPVRVIRKVGLMAECFFLYYEELDWGIRIRKEGYQLWFVHDSVIYHKESVSTGRMSPLKTYYLNRGRLLYLRRNSSGIPFFMALLFQLFVAVPKNTLRYLFSSDNGHLAAYLNAIFWHIRNSSAKDIHTNPVL